MATITLTCDFDDCDFTTGEKSELVACTLLNNHSATHQRASRSSTGGNAPKLERPKVDMNLTLEDWNLFNNRLSVFLDGSNIPQGSVSSHVFQCATEGLANAILKCDPKITTKPKADVLELMKSLAVIQIAKGVVRAELMSLSQDRDEQIRTCAARVRGKAETCDYKCKCVCTKDVDFTDHIIRDVIIAGVADIDIRREVLGTDNLLQKSVNDVVSLIEQKEMALQCSTS